MAQIIKHRRGSLESVSGATKRAGELLVVTGSSGITAANGDTILLVGIDGSTVTPSNKFLQGTSVPDLTGASYDTSVDGIPFYDTSAEKLYILNKGGNTEVKATANTGGTGIVSSSAQVSAFNTFLEINGDSIVSSSAQVVSLLDSQDVNLGGISGSSLDVTGNAKIDGNLTLGGNITIGDATTDTISITADLTSDLRPDADNDVDLGSASNRFAQIHGVNIYGAINATNNVVSSSNDTATVDLDITSGVLTANVIGGVHSGSAQVVASLLNQATDFGTGRVSGDNFGDAAGTSTFTGSFVGDGSGLTGLATNLIISASDDGTNDSLDLLNDSLIFAGTANELEVSVDSATNTVEFGLVTNPTLSGNVTVTGDLQVQGTTTTIDSTTVNIGDNIIELNGTGAVYGGLMVGDVTAPNQVSGSILWDATNDRWIAGASGSEENILLANSDGVVSGSAQIDLSGVTGDTDDVTEGATNLYYTDARVKTKLNADTVVSSSAQISAFGVFAELNGDDLVSSSAQVVSLLDSQDVNLGGISGSTLDLTGNAKIDGNITLGGNITIGDQSTDTISFGGEVSSDIIPSADNTYDLGSSSDRFAEIHGTTIFGSISATNGVVSGSSQVVSLLADQATDFGTGRVSGDNFGDVEGTSTFTGSFVGDGSGLTGLVSDLRISGSSGDDIVSLLNDDLTFAGGTSPITVAVTDNTVTVNVADASTSAKGLASFVADDFSVSSGNVSIKDGGVRAVNLNADVAGTGISLNGVDNSVEVDYGSTAGTAVEGNTSLVIQGTTNEIEVGSGSVTLGSGGTVTLGLPNDVTIGNDLTVTNDATISNNLTVVGNLSVQGTTTTVDSTTVQIGDNVLELNYGGAQDTAGLLVTDATAPNTDSGSLVWDGTNDYWKAGILGSEKELARFNTDPTSGSVQVIGADGLLVDSTISDDGTDVSITGDFTINGLSTANSFVYADGDKTLTAVQPSNAGDLIQWNGSSFVASNEIDGGTF